MEVRNMRRTIILLVTATLIATAAGLMATPHRAPAEVAAHSKTVVFHVDGMTCTLCKHAVEKALGSVAGVERSDVDPNTGRVLVTVRPDVQPDTLATAITAAGYPAQLIEVR
jgi:copper chaperone CopZ